MEDARTTASTQLVATTVNVEKEEHWSMAHFALVINRCSLS